jgi:uncharacterized protein (DUF1501 family)
MHEGLGAAAAGGRMHDNLAGLATALAAFATDTALLNVTVLTISEFGRRVAENGSGGLDHGSGNVAFVLGGSVNGGTVYGTWPGLAPADTSAGDLKVTTDYRVVLGEILEKRCGLSATTVLPGLPTDRLGIVKQA